jgi:hypothetical protein
MEILAGRYEPETPEGLVAHLVHRLRHHVLWDFLLIYLPPLIAGIHCVTDLYRRAWITQTAFVVAVVAAAALTLVVIMYCYRLALPSVRLAAHLIDEHAGATDRFITLSTLEPLSCPPSLLRRLRAEATGFLRRVKLKHDFPYKLKRSFYRSLLGSLVFASLFHLLLPIAESRFDPGAVPARLREVAVKMEQRPQMAALARALQRLAARIEDPDTSREEKQSAVQEMQRKIEQEQNKEEQKDNHDLLSQAASTLKGVEQQSGNGQEQQKNQDKGGGGIQSNLPQEGQGEGKSSAGSGGDSKGEVTAQLSKDMQEGKTAQGDPKDQGKEKNQQKAGEGKGDHPDPSQADRDKSQDMSGKTQGDREDKLGKSKQSEDIPRGAPPAERFNRPGEQGNEGIKGARYVTVQLPEDVAADSKGEATGAKNSKSNRVGPKLPVSNVPLPAHVADAPTEKQQVPLEYRELIR